jgi:hypothetical protein
MIQRGRKSKIGMDMVALLPGQGPQPPNDLTRDQRRLWNEIVATKPNTFWKADSFPLLKQYIRHITTADIVNEQIDEFDPARFADDQEVKRYHRLLSIRATETATIANLATKMRLTQASTVRTENMGTIDKLSTGQDKPWAQAA